MLWIDAKRVDAELSDLGAITDTPAPSDKAIPTDPRAVTRVLWTPTDLRGRAWVRTLLEAAGLEIRTDAIGTIFARWHGSDPEASPVATGSHVDAIPNAGRFDGCVGVIGAIEAIRALQRTGFTPRRSIDLIVFASEEPTRFGIGCFGSRLMTGALTPEDARVLRDADGIGVEEARATAGHDGTLESVRLPVGAYHAFVELHIEQGPVLERLGIPVGIVTAIAAPTTLRVLVTGEGGHAGGLLMADRHDALSAAAEMVLVVEATARQSGSVDTVATVGQLSVFPGAVNGVPSRVTMSVDIRDVDGTRRDRIVETICARFRTCAVQRGVEVVIDVVTSDPPATMDADLIDVLEASAHDASVRCHRLPSRAYHDALFMPLLCPTAMIFVPSRHGYSHRPDEFTAPDEVGHGVHVLGHVLARLTA